MKQWLSSHPDKIAKDWLLECRCSETDREPLRKLLDICDNLRIEYDIPATEFSGSNHYTDGEYLEFDIAFNGAIKYLYDMDAPREIFDSNGDYTTRVLDYLSWKTGEPRTGCVNDAPLTFAIFKNVRFFEKYFCDWRYGKLLENLKIDKGIK